MSAKSLVVLEELQLWLTSIGEESADSHGLLFAGLCDRGVDTAGDRGCDALEAPGWGGL